jgi:hypothetical protein
MITHNAGQRPWSMEEVVTSFIHHSSQDSLVVLSFVATDPKQH